MNKPVTPRLGAACLAQVSAAALAGTADHTKFKELQGPFKSGPEVTQACLACHNKAGHQVMKSIHWTWEAEHNGKMLGNRHAANSFCGSPISNELRCTSCHAGYNWTDKHFDFNKQENVDWPALGIDRWLSLEFVAVAHTLGAFLITAFFFIHVYLTTTGHTVFAHIKAMITGWEDIHETPGSDSGKH